MKENSIYDKCYTVSLNRFEEDEEVSGTWITATLQNLIDIIRIFSGTHKITIKEVLSGDE